MKALSLIFFLTLISANAFAAASVQARTCEVIATFGPDLSDFGSAHGVIFPTSSELPTDLKKLLEKRGYKTIDFLTTANAADRAAGLSEAQKRGALILDFSADVLYFPKTGDKFCKMEFELRDPDSGISRRENGVVEIPLPNELAKGSESSGSHVYPPEWLCTSVEGKIFAEIPSCESN